MATPMTDPKYLEIHCPINYFFEKIVSGIHIPQSKNIDTVRLSIPNYRIQVAATDSSGHTFRFSQSVGGDPSFHPLRHVGKDITTLYLDRGMT